MVGRNGVTEKILESKINEETDRNEESNSKEKKKEKRSRLDSEHWESYSEKVINLYLEFRVIHLTCS